MPHIIVEYSSNIEPSVAAAELLQRVHQTALASSIFEPGAVRTRAAPRELYLVGDDTNTNGSFVHITVRLREGRPAATLQALTQSLLDATLAYFKAAEYADPLLMNVEIHELPPLRVGARLNVE